MFNVLYLANISTFVNTICKKQKDCFIVTSCQCKQLDPYVLGRKTLGFMDVIVFMISTKISGKSNLQPFVCAGANMMLQIDVCS